MTLRHLTIFVSVYQNQSITKASEQLHIVQPSVSLAVRELEGYYGFRLFDRIGKRLYNTSQGTMFYEYAVHITSLFDEMETGIKNWEQLGTLRIGSSITIGNMLLPSFVKQLKEHYPEIEVLVSICNSTDVEQLILDNAVDLALTEGITSHPQIHTLPFMDDRLCLICAPSHPMAFFDYVPLEKLADYDFLLRESGSAGREIFESILTSHQIIIKKTWESVSTQAIIKAVKEGLGISVLPWLLVKDELNSGNLIEKEIRDISLSRKFSILYHKNKFLTPAAKHFMDLCITYEGCCGNKN